VVARIRDREGNHDGCSAGGGKAMTYPLGWPVVTQSLMRRERWPGGHNSRGVPLVRPGQEVQADQAVMLLEKPDIAEAVTGFPHVVSPSASYAGLSPSSEGAQIDGRYMQETVLAGMRGQVVDITHRGGVIIETRAAVIQGVIGAGNQVAGVLTVWNAGSSFPLPGNRPVEAGAILVVPGPLNYAMLRQATGAGIAGVVASSISSRDLEDFLRANVIALINSNDIERAQAHLPSITLLFTEGLGTIAMPARTINLLRQYHGSIALMSGATSIRRSIFPELVISLAAHEVQYNWRPVQPDPTLTIGSRVRICSGSHEGVIGEINYFFTHQQTFESDVRGRAARLRLEDGSSLVIALAIIERIG
jgi:hypothetical protein